MTRRCCCWRRGGRLGAAAGGAAPAVADSGRGSGVRGGFVRRRNGAAEAGRGRRRRSRWTGSRTTSRRQGAVLLLQSDVHPLHGRGEEDVEDWNGTTPGWWPSRWRCRQFGRVSSWPRPACARVLTTDFDDVEGHFGYNAYPYAAALVDGRAEGVDGDVRRQEPAATLRKLGIVR